MSALGITKRVLAPAFIGVVGAVIGFNEGYSTSAYLDSAGIPTVCYGSTTGVKYPSAVTDAECTTRLKVDLESHLKALDKLPDDLPDSVLLGSIDFAYNIGVSGFRNSSVHSALLRRDYQTASANVLKWKYITVNGRKYDCSVQGNTVCYGLWKRRVWQSKAIGNQYSTLNEAKQGLMNE
ncbi:putative endolysin [Proteus phage PM16]|uniref:Lysozyme n=1 Tax=Proteus phage PM16 TaxID=1357704 RepID=A0A0A6ZK76_9CAUD|nr:putative endolysin [Proteus phage PM16]AGZ17288.1 putative endolysin [Proteus phage PM16]